VGNIGRLSRENLQNSYRVSMKCRLTVRVANIADGALDHTLVIDLCSGCDFSSDDDRIFLAKDFSGDPRMRVLREIRVQNRIGDVITPFVGMPFRNRFGCEGVSGT
jgi:hypothetical protein